MNRGEFGHARIALNSKLLKKLKDVSAVKLRFRNKIIIRSRRRRSRSRPPSAR